MTGYLEHQAGSARSSRCNITQELSGARAARPLSGERVASPAGLVGRPGTLRLVDAYRLPW